eukprot:Em0022g549a
MNILISGKAPLSIARFIAGARLIAQKKIKEGCPYDVRPIAVGEILRRLAGKCVCAVLKEKAADFFHPLQYGVACQAGAEKIMHRCYGSHPLLWHPLGKITSECGVQQDDPLGPLLFSLALHKLVSSIDADDGCSDLLLQTWYLDDGSLQVVVLQCSELCI